jgi:FG-GAP-like repeat
MNGDALPDLVIATGGPGSTSGTVSLLLNPGGEAPPASWEKISLPTPGDYGRVAVGDIDGDGVNDVAALTFGTHVLRWWLLDADHSVRDERSMSFAGAALPGRQCGAPRPVTASPPTLASLAFADLDVDHALELGVAGYLGGAEGGLFLFSFQRETGCFELHRSFAQATGGSLRLRFFDVDDDGELDLVTSHYALARPTPALAGCSDCLEWGEWWSTRRATAVPLVVRFGNRALRGADPVPELNVVDFDVVRSADGVRFALAGSAHLCPARDCWTEGHGGFVSVVDADGNERWSGDGWKEEAEQEPPVAEARLLPRVVSFGVGHAEPALVSGYWWGTRRKDSRCSRVSACPGPVTTGVQGTTPVVLEPGSFVQALAFTGREKGPSKQHCEPQSRRLISLPEVPGAVLELRSKGHVLPAAAHSWVSGSNVVSLSAESAQQRGPLCIVYATSARPQLAVADSKHGLRLISLH